MLTRTGVVRAFPGFGVALHQACAILAALTVTMLCGCCGDSTPTPARDAFLYLTSSSIVGYRLDQDSGALTSIPGATQPGEFITTSASGVFLYAIDRAAKVLAYAVDPTTGALSAIANSYSPRVLSFHLVADPRGEFLYTLESCENENPNPCSDFLRVFRVDKNTGAITGEAPGSPFAVGYLSNNILVHPSGDFVYAPGILAGEAIPQGIWGFRVDRTAGTLVPIPGSPFTGIQATQSNVGVFHPTLPFLYIAEYEGAIRTYRIDPPTGALTSVARLQLPAFITGMDMDPFGRYVYTSVWKGAVRLLSVNASTGALSFTGGPTWPDSGYSFDGVYAHPSGRILFASETDGGGDPDAKTLLRVLSIDGTRSTLTDIAGSPLTVIGDCSPDLGGPARVRSLENSRWTLVVPLTSSKLQRLNLSADYTSVSALDPTDVPTLSYAVSYVRGGAAH